MRVNVRVGLPVGENPEINGEERLSCRLEGGFLTKSVKKRESDCFSPF